MSSAMPRIRHSAAWVWMLTKPGITTRPGRSSRTAAPNVSASSARRPMPEISLARDGHETVLDQRLRGIAGQQGRAGQQQVGHGVSRSEGRVCPLARYMLFSCRPQAGPGDLHEAIARSSRFPGRQRSGATAALLGGARFAPAQAADQLLVVQWGAAWIDVSRKIVEAYSKDSGDKIAWELHGRRRDGDRRQDPAAMAECRLQRDLGLGSGVPGDDQGGLARAGQPRRDAGAQGHPAGLLPEGRGPAG